MNMSKPNLGSMHYMELDSKLHPERDMRKVVIVIQTLAAVLLPCLSSSQIIDVAKDLPNESPEIRSWIDSVLPRLVKISGGGQNGSGILIDSTHGMNVVLTASHVVKPHVQAPIGPSGDRIGIAIPSSISTDDRSKLASTDFMTVSYGSERGLSNSFVSFPFFAPQSSSHPSPEFDFALLMVTGQSLSQENLGYETALKTPVDNRPIVKTEIRSPIEGEISAIVGYPEENQKKLSYSVGQILSSKQAAQLIKLTSSKAPFNSKVEFIILAEGGAGMSGGGVFDERGHLIGIIVRAGRLDDISYVRVTRADFIAAEIKKRISKNWGIDSLFNQISHRGKIKCRDIFLR